MYITKNEFFGYMIGSYIGVIPYSIYELVSDKYISNKNKSLFDLYLMYPMVTIGSGYFGYKIMKSSSSEYPQKQCKWNSQ